jgi:adenylylsulfate kinase
MGLPGSGKTTLAEKLSVDLFPNCLWLNADIIREQYNDWDFSYEGRIRQATRMLELANTSKTTFVIADFVCPLQEMREIFNADVLVWMDTIDKGRFADTNQIFTPPVCVDYHVTDWNDPWVHRIANDLKNDHTN